MRMTVMALLASLLGSWIPIGCAPGPTSTRPPPGPPLVAFLVRHAEKLDASRDAALSAAGRERAAALADTLRSAGIEHVHSSDFSRTRDTAAPTAAMLAVPVQLYDPDDLPGLAAGLRQTGGRHLVVGHSNTTPALAALLGGETGGPIDEAHEYDRLTIITIGKHGVASGVLLRYGKPSRHP